MSASPHVTVGDERQNQARRSARIKRVDVSGYTVPTDQPESDGTVAWDKTTMVLVEISTAGKTGIGYSYADAATAGVITSILAPLVKNSDALDIARLHSAMVREVRNLGRAGICAMAISAVDNALWDLKAKLLDMPLFKLLGAVRDEYPIYGSGGFTSYSDEKLREQLSGWVEEGIPRVKMKVGREPARDIERVRAAREAIGAETELFVDANSAYDRKQALHFMEIFAEDFDAIWMEQPLASEDRAGMRWLRERGPAAMDVADGEYGYEPAYFRAMLEAGAVDVAMPDTTRCGGITGFLAASAVCDAFEIPVSAHCAPTQTAHVGCAAPNLRHGEFFHDHARIERMFFDGFLEPRSGAMYPDPSRPGLGIEFKRADAERYRIKI